MLAVVALEEQQPGAPLSGLISLQTATNQPF